MSKKIAVIAFNPVNGMGLFQYLEAFFENTIAYRTFAIGDNKEISTNSRVPIILDDIIANLKGKESEYDALVFACGDAMLRYRDESERTYYEDMRTVLQNFANADKLIIGHCAAAVIFDQAGIIEGKRVAVHPYGKASILQGIATDEKVVIDKNIYTAQCENSIWILMPDLLKALKS